MDLGHQIMGNNDDLMFLMISLSLSLSLSLSRQRAVSFGTEYKRQYFSFDGNLTLQQVTGPSVLGAAVFL